MKKSTILTVIVATACLSAVVFSFMNNASPYVTAKQARAMSGDRLHLACQLDRKSIKNNIVERTLEFFGTDSNGERVRIRYQGENVNLKDATQVVAVGKFDGDAFRAEQLLVKCPSKYEEDKAGRA